MRLLGWRLEGRRPEAQRYLLVGGPHTSNWDFLIFLLAAGAYGFDMRFMAKSSLLRPPLGWLVKLLGGVAVDRSGKGGDVVGASVEAFRTHDDFVLGVFPKGTRSRRPTWKSGFYHIARGADVPLVLISADYRGRVLRASEPLVMTGVMEADMGRIRVFFDGVQGKRPEFNDVVRLEAEQLA